MLTLFSNEKELKIDFSSEGSWGDENGQMLWNSIQTFSFFNCLLNPGSAPFHCPTFYDQVPSFKLPPRNFSPIFNQHCLTWGKRFPENWSKFVSFFQSSVNNLNQVSCLCELNELRVKSVTKKKTFLLCSKEEPHEVLNPFEALPWKPLQWQWWCEDGFKVAEEATMGSGPPCHGLHLLVSHQSATRDQPASHQQATRSTLVTTRSPQATDSHSLPPTLSLCWLAKS